MPQPATTKKAAAQKAQSIVDIGDSASDPFAKSEHPDEDEVAYHRTVIAQAERLDKAAAAANLHAIPPVERLDEGEMAYHRTVLAQAEAAATVFNSWAAHLNAKYGLTPADRLDNATGVITRAAKEE